MKDKALSGDNKNDKQNVELKQSNQTPDKTAPKADNQASGATASDNKTCAVSSKDSAGESQKLQEEIESLRKAAAERNEFLNLLQRVQADFANYQKRIKKEKECWDKYQDESLLKELLPAIDGFGRTLKTKCTSEEAKCIQDGVELIKREIFRIMEKRGLKQIKTIGEKFDPNVHEAVAISESAQHKENEIVNEIAPGFMLYDRLIRAAKVVIAKKPKEEKKEETKSVEPKAS